MSKDIQPGKTYLYRKYGGRTFHVNVIRVRGWFALCQWRVNNVDFDYSFEKTGWRPIWRMF